MATATPRSKGRAPTARPTPRGGQQFGPSAPTTDKYDPRYIQWLEPNRGKKSPRGNWGPEDYDPHTGLPYGQPGEAPDSGPFRERTTQDDWANKAIALQNKNQQGYNDYRAAHGMPPIRPNYTGNTGPLTYQPGGPYPPAAGGPGAKQQGAPQTGPGSAQAWNKLYASQQKGAAPAAAAPDYAKIRGGMKPGQTLKQGGKSYFLNQNGALVDVTDPKKRQRLTDVKGNVLGAKTAPAAAPPQSTQDAQYVSEGGPSDPTQQGGQLRNLAYQMSPEEVAAQRQQEQQMAPWNGYMLPGYNGPPISQMPGYGGPGYQGPMQRPSFSPGMGGGMANMMGGALGGMGGGVVMPGAQQFMGDMGGGYGGGMGGMYQPMQNSISGFGGLSGGMGNWVNDLGGGYGGMDMNQMYAPEASMMNPYNPNMQMYY